MTTHLHPSSLSSHPTQHGSRSWSLIVLGVLCSVALLTVGLFPVACGGPNPSEQIASQDGGVPPEQSTTETKPPVPRACQIAQQSCCIQLQLEHTMQAHDWFAKPSSSYIVYALWTLDGKDILLGGESFQSIRMLHYPKGLLHRSLTGHSQGIRYVARHPSKNLIASSSSDKTIKLWNPQAGTLERTLTGHTSSVYGLAFFRTKNWLASASEDRTVRIWDTASGTLLHTYKDAKSRVTRVAVSHDEKWLAGTSSDGRVYIWDVEQKKLHKSLRHSGPSAVQFMRSKGDSKEYLIGGFTDAHVRVWEMPDVTTKYTLKAPKKSKAHDRGVYAIGVLPSGKQFVTGGDDGFIRVWNISDGTHAKTIKVATGNSRTISVHPKADVVLVAGSRKTVGVHDVNRDSASLHLSSVPHRALSIGADETQLFATRRGDTEIKRWNPVTRKQLPSWKEHKSPLSAIAYHSGKKWLASSAEDGEVKLWDAKQGKVLKTLTGMKHASRTLLFDPKGAWLAAVAYTGVLYVWSLPDGALKKELLLEESIPQDAKVSPSGQRLAIAMSNGSVHIIDTASWSKSKTFKRGAHSSLSVAFIDGEKQILTGYSDGTLRRWDLASGSEIGSFQSGGLILGLHYSPQKKLIFSLANDAKIKVLNEKANKLLYVFQAHSEHAYAMDSVHSRNWLFTFDKQGIAYRWDIDQLKPAKSVRAHEGKKVLAIAISYDNKFLATGSEDHSIHIWERATHKLIRTLKGHKEAITSLSFHPKGQWLVSGSYDKTAKVWDYDKGTERHTLKGNLDRVYSVRFSPDGTQIATGGGDWSIRIYTTETGKQIKEIVKHKRIVTSVAWSPDGKLLASGSYDKSIKLWDTQNWQETKTLTGHQGGVSGVVFRKAGNTLLSTSFDQTIRSWYTSGKGIRTYSGHKQGITSIALHPSSNFFITTSNDKTVRFWRFSGTQDSSRTDHTGITTSACYTSDGAYAYTASEDGTYREWLLASPRRAAYTSTQQGVTALAWHPKNTSFATSSRDNTVKVWDSKTYGSKRLYYRDDTEQVRYDSTGKYLGILVRKDGLVLYDTGSKKNVRTIKPQDKEDAFIRFDFHPNGQSVITASKDTQLRVWNTADGKLSDILKGHKKPISAVRYSADGALLLSGSEVGQLKLWSSADGTTIKSWEGHKQRVTSIAFAPKAPYVATTSEDGKIKVWSTQDGTLKKEWCLEEAGYTVQFSPDGKWLTVGTGNGKVRIFQVQDWQHAKTLQGPFFSTTSLKWSSNTKRLIASFENGDVHFWSIQP